MTTLYISVITTQFDFYLFRCTLLTPPEEAGRTHDRRGTFAPCDVPKWSCEMRCKWLLRQPQVERHNVEIEE